MITFKVPSGIGDNIWLFQKLLSTGQKFHFQIADTKPQRGKQIFDLMPQLVESVKYVPMNIRECLRESCTNNGAKFSDLDPNGEYFLSFNTALDNGTHITDLFPDLNIQYTYLPFKTDDYTSNAFNLMQDNSKYYCGIYCSAYKNNKNWGGWSVNDWFNLCKNIADEVMQKHHKKTVFVIFGASYDMDLTTELIERLNNSKFLCLPIIDNPLGLVIELISNLKYFVSFPSGLPVIATTLNIDTLMLYPPKLEKLMYSWVDNTTPFYEHYTPMLWSNFKDVFNTIKNKL